MAPKKMKLDWTGLGKKMEEASKGKASARKVDPRFYLQKFSDDGTAQSIIRFLPSPDTDIPLVSVFSHRLDGPGGFYSQNCPTTIGERCPVCDANRAVWSTNENLARNRSRKKKWIANIKVIKDPNCPENEGKCFLFRFPKTVYDKIWMKIQPPKGSVDEPVIVFDPAEGANFKLISERKKIKLNGKDIVYPDYKDSSFAEVSELEDWDDIQEKLFELGEFTAADQFKSYDELQNRFMIVSGRAAASISSRPTSSDTVVEDDSSADSGETQSFTATADLNEETNDDDFLAKLRKGKKNNK